MTASQPGQGCLATPDPEYTQPWQEVPRADIYWRPTIYVAACGTCVTGRSRLVYRRGEPTAYDPASGPAMHGAPELRLAE